ncbi:uncharacterized protein E0L32_002599 [Thyridium curvatum]|uniref:Uncharacterized protein n=1 Tax=Thyridium curvatum TaxID=1093900 RepID=A0A507B8V7_9PEZI|nr:uncharacterized protein E0L32_002599 [Thyridium curvatum]TPX18742.1 hypothetical protein E0L32_002599 [Thyridium curvatum]
MKSPLALTVGALLLPGLLASASPVIARDGTLCDNLTNPLLFMGQVKRYIQDILYDPNRGIKDLTPEARDQAALISAALDAPLADVQRVRAAAHACPAGRTRRAPPDQTVRRQEGGTLCDDLDHTASELQHAKDMADELASMPTGEKVQTGGIKSQLDKTLADVAWAKEKLSAAGRC